MALAEDHQPQRPRLPAAASSPGRAGARPSNGGWNSRMVRAQHGEPPPAGGGPLNERST
ncbi:MAG: hypothetical protein MZV70_75785 [Desulfobacterales bacterium]|nr:hypothetical protein [Desulfobacterales bacterium]